MPDYYQGLLDLVCGKLSDASLAPTSRVKTTGILTEKLQRDHGMKLSRIQDVAGARVVIDGDRNDQDVLVGEICGMFADFPRKPDIVDRRSSPRQGYRAVHIVVYPEGFPVEIQVRTDLQDIWAQIFERLADQWGRQIRYGEEPDPVPLTADDTEELVTNLRTETVALLMRISSAIDQTETTRANAREARALLEVGMSQSVSLPEGNLRDLDPPIADRYRRFRTLAIQALERSVKDRRRRRRLIRRLLPKVEVKPDTMHKAMAVVGTILSDGMLDFISRTHTQEALLREALQHIAQLSEKDIS